MTRPERCEWCGQTSQVDARGGCVACGGPRAEHREVRDTRSLRQLVAIVRDSYVTSREVAERLIAQGCYSYRLWDELT